MLVVLCCCLSKDKPSGSQLEQHDMATIMAITSVRLPHGLSLIVITCITDDIICTPPRSPPLCPSAPLTRPYPRNANSTVLCFLETSEADASLQSTQGQAPADDTASSQPGRMYKYKRWLGHWKPEYDQIKTETELALYVSA